MANQVRTVGAGDRPVTLITGAAGRLGAAVAEAMLSRGSIAFLSDVNAEALDSAANALRSPQRQLLTRPADLSSEDETARLIEDVIAQLGRLDVCVHCAGIEGPVEPIENLDIDAVIRVYEVNVFAALRVMKHTLRYFKERRNGRIITIASGAGLAGSDYMAAYSSSKHAVIGLTRSAAREAARYNVSVNAVCPGCIESPMMGRIEEALTTLSGSPVSFAPGIPMQRYASPAEVAEFVAYLALEAPAYITGAALVIDGGMRA